jgi:hypothetical protein
MPRRILSDQIAKYPLMLAEANSGYRLQSRAGRVEFMS